MSMSTTTYVGPFVRCEYHLIKVPNPHKVCFNDSTHYTYGGDYCNKCGAKIVTVDHGRDEASVSYWTVFSDAGLDEDHMSECHGEGCEVGAELQEHWYIRNHSRGEPRDFSFGAHDPAGLYANGLEIDIDAEKSWLEKAFAPEIKALRSVYDTVTVTWGIIRTAR